MAPTLQLITCEPEHGISSKDSAAGMKEEKYIEEEEEEEEEDEEDLFEIDLEAVGNLSPPCYWGTYLTATKNTLFANCLVPIEYVSSAVPMANLKDAKQTWMGYESGTVVWVRGALPLQNFVGVSSLGALSNLLQKTLDVSSSLNQGK
ncbi:unnamed protein product [Lactuca virosa]|uniref:Uncharacterized protein n=1 Tax=Lactuca virosa TaxID=75947 RepID=A0AAU9PQN8_9ASTR|nr:unnamed protein product [Lactuca virosa]